MSIDGISRGSVVPQRESACIGADALLMRLEFERTRVTAWSSVVWPLPALGYCVLGTLEGVETEGVM